MSIKQNLKHILSHVPEHVTLVAVSKTKPVSDIMEAYDAGHRHFGENKIQEMVEKYEQLPNDIQWHAIGHVQRNKVKYMAPFVSLIHAVDSLKLLKEINKQAAKHDRVISCLLQIKIAEEDTKFGMSASDAKSILTSGVLLELKHVNIVGLMGMATFTEDSNQIKQEFDKLKELFDECNSLNDGQSQMTVLSMGMSGDFEIAIACGSNMIRVGSRIFGERNYN